MSDRRGWRFDLREWIVRRLVERVRHGQLNVVLPNGVRLVSSNGGESASLTLHRWRALYRVLVQSDIGFAQAFIDGDCSSPDLVGLLRLFDRNLNPLGVAASPWGPSRWLHRLAHAVRRNSRRGSRRNIMAHYDLGDAFFAEWLDPTMSYSSAIYRDPDDGLETAQAHKLDRIAEMLRIRGGEVALEIGCGWGALADKLLSAGVSAIDALTLSPSQQRYAQGLLQDHGARARVLLRDYRESDGQYDRIVSIEMCEAVGETYLPIYFETIARRLKAGGRAVIQAITIADGRFRAYRENADFIQRFVFPGGFLPSDSMLADCIKQGRLRVVESETFGASYALTLAEWRKRFHAHWPRIAQLGFDARFRRLWDYYLCYCEAGFREGVINVGLYALEPL